MNPPSFPGRARATSLWFWPLLALVLALGAFRLRFDVEVLNLLPAHLPVAQGLKTYQQHFSDARELIVTVEHPSPAQAEAAAESLAGLLRAESNLVADVSWQPAWLEHPAEACELVAALWLSQPPEHFEPLARRLAPTNLPSLLAETRERLATSLSPSEVGLRGYDPFGLLELPAAARGTTPAAAGEEWFVAPDGTFRLVFVQARPDLTTYRACRAWLDGVQSALRRAQREGLFPDGTQFDFTGRPAFVTEIAGGMEQDMSGSAGGTLLTIGVLFWLTHRRIRPLFWLLIVLVMILAGTTTLGGLCFGTVNVVSMGFAAILLGLAEDFGIVIYQESRSHPELDAKALRREVAPGIFWSTLTSSGAFLMLNASSLPGLGQLGSFVAIGLVLAAFLMLYGFLSPLLRMRRPADLQSTASGSSERFLLFTPGRLLPPGALWGITALLAVVACGALHLSAPRFDRSTHPLRPKMSHANAALERIKSRFQRPEEPLWILIAGRDEQSVHEGLLRAEYSLSNAVARQEIASFNLPVPLWPNPTRQQQNRPHVASIVRDRGILRQAALQAGFTADALKVTEALLDHWQRALDTPGVFWPTNAASRRILGKVMARTPEGLLALGLVHATGDAARTRAFAAALDRELAPPLATFFGWDLLGLSVFDTVLKELPRVALPVLLLVILTLGLTFRSWRDTAWSLGTLGFSGLCLAGAMGLLGWDWNILNLMAIPLLLGMGVDYSIHIQLALRRHGGDRLAVRRSVGRALLLAGSTTVAGFASLAFSSNAGMASLGRVCALGIAITLATAVYLLPAWWGWTRRR